MSDLKEEQDIVRLGSNYTQVAMSDDERKKAIQSAYWRTASECEWTWSLEDQARMALYVLWAYQRLEMIENLSSGKSLIHEP